MRICARCTCRLQALLEVKTASGNLFLALYEDVVRFLALMDRVCGRTVTFSLSDSTRMTLQVWGAHVSTHMRGGGMSGCADCVECGLLCVARGAARQA
eukprot:364811-Chlamydomonas_euryale.AAC.11